MPDRSASGNDVSVVFITGAAGGLGRALVAGFQDAGWHVAAGCHKSPFAGQPTVWASQIDVTDVNSIETWIDGGISRWGRIDALINNAGVKCDAPSWTLPASVLDQVLSVNLKGAAICSRAVMKTLCARREGHIINISSFAARAGSAGQAGYCAAKAGMIGLTQSLAREAGPANVRVNAVMPGVLSTAMTADLSPDRLREFAEANVLGRINSLEEAARFIVFLAATRNISGQVFQIDSRIAPWT